MHLRDPDRPLSRSRRRQVGAAVVAAIMVAATLLLDSRAPAVARPGATWYVSRNGDGTVGTSWTTAWTELSDIDWSAVNPGDHIVIDGGPTRCPSNYPLGATTLVPPGHTCGMEYRTPLTIRGNGAPEAPITISLSTSPGHDGTAVLFGGRATPLPYCDQQSYRPVGHSRLAGIMIPGRHDIVINGSHRSGIMVYGADSGVDLHSDHDAYVTLRNLEVFDNGTYSTWPHGYRTDGEGISLAGQHIVIDRDLIHDNGQDAIQDRYTGVPGIGHAALRDITITNSWLYERREHPLFRGFGFNSGAQEIRAQACTHVDGLQIWGGGLHQQRMTFRDDVFGPFLAQGVYPGDNNTTSFDHVVVSDSLFLNMLDHAIIGPAIGSDPSTPRDWRIRNVTSYMTDRPNRGIDTHGKVDLAGSGHQLSDSVFYNGYFPRSPITGHGNIWWGGDPVPGGRRMRVQFPGTLPGDDWPSYATLVGLNLTPLCAACDGVGSPIDDVHDVLRRIDSLNQEDRQ